MNEKGLSAIISVLLMIGVSLVIAGLLFIFAGNFAREQISSITSGTQVNTSCAFLGLKIDDNPDSATRALFDDSNNTLRFKLSNTGNVNITRQMLVNLAAETSVGGSLLVSGTLEADISKGSFILVNFHNSSADPAKTSTTSFADVNVLNSLRVTPSECPSNFAETSTIDVNA